MTSSSMRSDIVLDVVRKVDPDMGDEDLQEHLSRGDESTCNYSESSGASFRSRVSPNRKLGRIRKQF